MAETVNLKFKVLSGDTSKKLKDIGSNLKNMSGNAKKTTSSMGSFYNAIRKVNNRMGNLNKDLNRGSNGFTKLTSRMTSLTSVFNIGTLAVYRLANALVSSVNGALDMIETLNLFEVSLGNMAVATDEFVQNLSEMFGLDMTNLRNAVGTYALLARSMGMNTEQASLLSKNITQLAIDYSSLTNVPIEQVMGDLKSGLVGQSETVYKYGLDVTEAGLKAEAMAEGITKSVRNMSQGEKMALRYNAMIRQSILAHGDFARTIETPANQIRVLTERFTTLSRTIGTIFIPILSFVLPYLNAIASVLITIAESVASFFGYKKDEVSNGVGGGLDNITDSSDEANDSISALQKTIMGFDEFNILQSTSSGGGAGSGGSILDDIELAEYNMITTAVNQLSDAIETKLIVALQRLKELAEPTTIAIRNLWNNGLSKLGGFAYDVLVGFYENFLVPIGTWTLGVGFPKLVDGINSLLEKIDWKSITKNLNDFWTAITPYAINFADGLIEFFLSFESFNVEVLTLFFGKNGLITSLISTLNNGDPEKAKTLATALGGLYISLKLFKIGSAVQLGLTALIGNLSTLATIGTISAVVTVGVLFTQDYLDWKANIDEYGWDEGRKKTASENKANPYAEDYQPYFTKFGQDLEKTYDKVRELSAETFSKTVDTIKQAFQKSMDWIEKNVFPFFTKEKWEKIGKGISDGLRSGLVSAQIILVSMVNGVITGFEKLVNTLIDGVNLLIKGKNLLTNTNSKTLGKVKYNLMDVPKLARGGIVDSEQIFMAGENGKEAIMPLENNTEWIQSLAMQISEFGGSGTDEVKIKRAFKEAIRESDFGDTVIQVDSEELARANNRGNKMLNRRYKVVLA